MVEGVLTGEKGSFDMPILLRLYGTAVEPAATNLKKAMQDAKLPVKDFIAAEEARKKAAQLAENNRKLRQKQEQMQALRRARAQGASVRFNGGQGQQFEARENSQFSNITIPRDDNSGDGSSGPSMNEIVHSSTIHNPRELGEVVEKNGATEEALAALPMAPQPEALETQLLPYQLQGLSWLLDREFPRLPVSPNETVQLWKRDARSKDMYTNIATSYTTKAPELASGGILADDMGLGKTIQIISLIVSDPNRGAGPTLIVAPLSVMSNWSGQIEKHVKSEHALKVFTYHGSSRSTSSPAELGSFDVVMTTYQTMALEYMPAKQKDAPKPVPRASGLFSVSWRRVILDEGHQIRNPKSKMAQAAYAIQGTSRWVLSGTPIVNNLRDLHSHVKFIRLTGGLERPEVFKSALMRPLSHDSPEAELLLQALISTLCLRRMKDMKFIDLKLPELSFHIYAVPWGTHEREKYDAFEDEAKGLMLRHLSREDGKGNNAYSHLLEVLLRMRQTCNHWKLCGERATKLLAVLEGNKKFSLKEPENVAALRGLLQHSIDSQEECAVCLERLHDPVITPCAHVFGASCIERVIEGQHKCPMCRAELQDVSELATRRTAGREHARGRHQRHDHAEC